MARLAELIRDNRDGVLDVWKGQVRTLRDARQLTETELLNHVPRLLDWLVERLQDRRAPEFSGHFLSREHANERFDEHFDLLEMLVELAVLRDVLLQLWGQHPEGIAPAELLHLNQDLDDVVIVATTEYTRHLLASHARPEDVAPSAEATPPPAPPH